MIGLLLRFLIGGLMYIGMEVMLDNSSDRSMGLVGGLAFVLCGELSVHTNFSLLVTCVIIACIITILEYIGGKVFNKDYSIWDYRNVKYNFQGQICLQFFLVWCFVIAPIIIIFYNPLCTIT